MIKFLLGWKGYAVVALAAASAGAYSTYYVMDNRHDRYVAEQQAAQAKLELEAWQAARTTETALREATEARLAMEKVQNENERLLRDRVELGTSGLRVAASCPKPAAKAEAPGVGERTGAELDPLARPTYFALRHGLNDMRADLDECRAYVRALTAP